MNYHHLLVATKLKRNMKTMHLSYASVIQDGKDFKIKFITKLSECGKKGLVPIQTEYAHKLRMCGKCAKKRGSK